MIFEVIIFNNNDVKTLGIAVILGITILLRHIVNSVNRLNQKCDRYILYPVQL